MGSVYPATGRDAGSDLDEVFPEDDLPVEAGAGQGHPLFRGAGVRRRHLMGQDERAYAGAGRRRGGLLDGGVVVDGVDEARHGHQAHEVFANTVWT